MGFNMRFNGFQHAAPRRFLLLVLFDGCHGRREPAAARRGLTRCSALGAGGSRGVCGEWGARSSRWLCAAVTTAFAAIAAAPPLLVPPSPAPALAHAAASSTGCAAANAATAA